METTFPRVDLYGKVARSEQLPGTNRTCETNSVGTLRSPGGLPSKCGHARPPASTRPQAIQESSSHNSGSKREHACYENTTSAWSVRPVPTGPGAKRLETEEAVAAGMGCDEWGSVLLDAGKHSCVGLWAEQLGRATRVTKLDRSACETEGDGRLSRCLDRGWAGGTWNASRMSLSLKVVIPEPFNAFPPPLRWIGL